MSFTPTGSAVNRTGFVALRALAEGPGEGPVTDFFFTANVIHKADVEVKGKGGVVIISIRLTYRGRERAQKKKGLNLHFLWNTLKGKVGWWW